MSPTEKPSVVLVVDDDQGLVSLIARRLKQAGFESAGAYSAAEALEWLACRQADLVLLDYKLPDMNGAQLVAELKQRDIDVPFIVVTGQGDERLAVEMMKQGARDYLAKDSGLLELLPSVVAQAIDQIERDRRLESAERALGESQDRLARVVESLPVVMMSTDARSDRTLLMMGAVEEILGCRPEAFTAAPGHLWTLVHSEDRDRVRQIRASGLESRQPFEMEYRIVHADNGKTVWIHHRTVPVADESGRLDRCDAILVDITEEKRIEAESRKLEEQLQRAQKLESLGVLAGGIAHDFSNLLAIIGSNVEFIDRAQSLAPPQAKALADIQAALRQARDMVRALQTLGRPGTPQVQPVELNAFVRDTHRFLRRLIPARIRFLVETAPTACYVLADPGQLQQVLVNLCVNARDAISDEGTIRMEVRRASRAELPATMPPTTAEQFAVVRVSDTGCGMDESTRRQAFDPFFTTKPKDQGTGLGLTIVYRIVEAHGGSIDLSSRPGGGTQVSLYFPLIAPPAQAEPSPAAGPTGSERILVVQNQEMIASLLRTVLESNGYKVEVAADPSAALALAGDPARRFDLAVIDQNLPDIPGEALLTRLRQLDPGLKALLTGGQELDSSTPPDAGTQILRKPVSAQDIARAVRSLLDGGK